MAYWACQSLRFTTIEGVPPYQKSCHKAYQYRTDSENKTLGIMIFKVVCIKVTHLNLQSPVRQLSNSYSPLLLSFFHPSSEVKYAISHGIMSKSQSTKLSKYQTHIPLSFAETKRPCQTRSKGGKTSFPTLTLDLHHSVSAPYIPPSREISLRIISKAFSSLRKRHGAQYSTVTKGGCSKLRPPRAR